MFIEFPTEHEWRDLSGRYSFERLNIPIDLFKYTCDPYDTLERFYALEEIS